MKVLVTGGTGFLGRHIAWRLAAEGCDVIFTGRREDTANDVVKSSPSPLRWLQLDHGSEKSLQLLEKEVVGVDAIIHCAALSSPWGRKEDFYQSNIASTKEVLAICEATNIRRLVHISTPSLYFDYRDRLLINENDEMPQPVNEYARTKAIAESLVKASSISEKVVLRPRAIFGPWDSTLMPRLLRAMERGSIPLMRGGKAQLDLTYIDNVVDAVWLALTLPLPRELCIYNVTNGEPIEFEDLLHKISKTFELNIKTQIMPWILVDRLARLLELISKYSDYSEPLLTRYSAGALAFSQTLNISAISNELGYKPRISISEGISHHADWWRSQQHIKRNKIL